VIGGLIRANVLFAASWAVTSTLAQTQPAPFAPAALPPALTARIAVCGACHGADGNATVPGTPSLSAQPRVFLENQLVVIREGLREIVAMKGLLDTFKDDELTQIAKHYATLPAKPDAVKLDEAKAKRGEALSASGHCGTCHLPDYSGREQMPRLSGQREDFLLASMQQFRAGQTKGRDTMMSSVLYGLSEADLADLAHFFATRR
jgi:cytochrome c553